MLFPELLRETLDTTDLECWERERPVVHLEGHERFCDYSVYNAFIRQSFSG